MKEERFTSKYTPTKFHAKYTPLSFSAGDMGTFRVGQGPGDGGVARPGGEEEGLEAPEVPLVRVRLGVSVCASSIHCLACVCVCSSCFSAQRGPARDTPGLQTTEEALGISR